jgi:hypothetical protein
MNSANEGMNLLVWNALAVWIINKLKYSKAFPRLNTETEKLNQRVSVFLAALAAAGVVFTVTHAGSVTTGAITISWAGLTVSNLVSFAYHWAAYFSSQKGLYKLWSIQAPSQQPQIVDKKAV